MAPQFAKDSAASEAHRLGRLQALRVLDSQSEPLFDAIVQAAALATGTPISLISLIDGTRQWFKANHGLEGVSETPREHAFCAHTIDGPDIFEVPDATKDPRFADNPLVTSSPDIRFYAGAPITLSDGQRMGSLCVIDREPATLTQQQRDILTQLANAAAIALEQRGRVLAYNELVEEHALADLVRAQESALLEREVRASRSFLDRTGRVAGVGGWEVDLLTSEISWSDETCRLHGVPLGYKPTLEEGVSFYAPEARATVEKAVADAIATGKEWDFELPFITKAGRALWVRSVGSLETEAGEPRRLVGAFQDVTYRKRALDAVQASERRFRKLFQYSRGLICTHDMEGMILSVNPAAAQSLGYSVNELTGRSLQDFMPADRAPAFDEYLERIHRIGDASGTFQLRASNGELRVWKFHNVLDAEGDETYVLGHAQDVTDERRYEKQLQEWSVRDPLTNCYNRRYLGQLESILKEGDQWGCLAVDLDNFKQVNDAYGHQRGDTILVDMAKFLDDRIGPADLVVRLGGDEFLVLLRGADAVQAQHASLRVEDAAAEAPIGFTLGHAAREPDETLEHAIARADTMLYEVRSRRRQRRGD